MLKQRHTLKEEPETNPDAPQQAVALKYDTEHDKAPKVTAKGRGYVAENILAAARQNTIPVYQNKSLVNMLMALEIDREIPPNCIGRLLRSWLMFIGSIRRRRSQRICPILSCTPNKQ